MNLRDKHILTHYTDITEARERDVRGLQAEVVVSILNCIGMAVGKALRRSRSGARSSDLDQAKFSGGDLAGVHEAAR